MIIMPPVADGGAVLDEAIIVDCKRTKRVAQRKTCFLGEFAGRRLRKVFAGFECPTRDLQFDLRKIRLVENQEPAAPGGLDQHLLRIRHGHALS
ncbi:hypothetical protein EV132_104455 [Rhizobium sullae]|uniref:Uncharacterized protein n=1 Tax=Rhizobium sullae TaxID=50338 RepID=A0A4R3QCZ0_RHISU|nr:hypothetical protein EV132_104455 [Rhizobium sullae]